MDQATELRRRMLINKIQKGDTAVPERSNKEQVCEERIDKLGDYFVYFNIRERFEITFERFVQIVDSGQWPLYQGV
jgi:hypothetical protein